MVTGQPNIHPGSISSTGRSRVAVSATSTQAAQLIGGGITPNMFTMSTMVYLFNLIMLSMYEI